MKLFWNQLSMAMLVLFAAGVTAPAATFFVGPNGSDTNGGLDRADAWQTIQFAVNQARPGDTIRVLAGSYAGARIENSGAEGAPIALQADDRARAILNKPGASNRHGGILELETWKGPRVVSYWIVQGLQFEGAPHYGIDLRSTSHVILRDNSVRKNGSTGVAASYSYDVVIEGNESCHNGEHGIYVNNSSDRFQIRGNRLHHNAYCGLHMNGDLSIKVPDGTPWTCDGIMSDGVVANNVIYDNGIKANGGAGINMDGVTRTVVSSNILYATHNHSGLALFRGNGAIPSRENLIAGNMVVMAADGGWAMNLADSGCVSNRLFNNTLYNSHSWRGSICIPEPALGGFESDSNLVIGRFSVDGGSAVLGLAAWQKYGYDRHSSLISAAEVATRLSSMPLAEEKP